MAARTVSLRYRSPSGEPLTVLRDDWDNAMIAVVICDMWDTIQCVSAARRVAVMAPRVNEVAARLRRDGALIVHAPAGCMDFYAGTAARDRARQVPPVQSPVPVDWHDWDASREAPLPAALADDTPCSCKPGEPCSQGGPPYPWTRQIESIEVSETDAVTDNGEELLALLEDGEIEDVVVMGVHANRCVLGRPYGIRQLVYWQKWPVLCRDLTDSYHRDPRGHSWGNEEMIAHIEQYWCPTLTSEPLVGGAPFRFWPGSPLLKQPTEAVIKISMPHYPEPSSCSAAMGIAARNALHLPMLGTRRLSPPGDSHAGPIAP